MPSPATGSAHHHPNSALAPRPTSSTAESSAHRFVCCASATAADEPMTGASSRLARARSGITASDSAAMTMPTTLVSGRAPPSRSRTASTPTYTESSTKLSAISRVARRSDSCMQPPRRSWAKRHVSTSAADTSMAESIPKPTRLTDPAATPAATATTPSIVFHPMVAALSHRLRRTAASRVARDGPTATAPCTCSATAVQIRMPRLDLELEGDEVLQRVHEPSRRQLVAHLPALARAADEAAPAQAREVVRDVRPRREQPVGELGRVRRAVEERHQDPASRRVGQRGAHSFERVERLHGDGHGAIVHAQLNSVKAESWDHDF